MKSGSQTVFMFSGQGSQYYHMASEAFEKNRTFRHWMRHLDEMARRSVGGSVIDALYSDSHSRADVFDDLSLTHPAIFMVEYSMAQTLMDAGLPPDKVLGVSVGSFAAAAVAGFIRVEAALEAVIRQAAVLQASCQPGGMIAVMADPALFTEGSLGERSELAAVNFSSHFVVSARERALEEVEASLRRRDVGYQRLPVTLPFHSRWIDEAESRFAAFMQTIPRQPGRTPLVCCSRAATLSELPDGYFWSVVRRPIRFRDATARLERESGSRYIDVGPAGTLATFLKHGLPATTESTVHSILTPFGTDERHLTALLATVGH